jgi:phosphatidylglycerol---prolipoprotein diacylglyceryl transferase
MLGPFVHNIDPVVVSVGGIHFWWYGLSYALGFCSAHLFLRRSRDALGLTLREVYDLSLFLAVGVLVGGRSLVVFNNEWAFYRTHLDLVPAIWLGGLATHGLIVGGAAGVGLYCSIHRRPILPVLDALAIPTALILGCGRIGNFIDGQIVGSVTSMPWGVKFPEAAGFRHPVVLYDGIKNFLLAALLTRIPRRDAPPGRRAATFIFLYASLRIPIDLLREYPITLWGLPTGQTFNLTMSAAGAALLMRSWLKARSSTRSAIAHRPIGPSSMSCKPSYKPRLAFAVIVALAATIPSDATRDIPSRYGRRHPGLVYSAMYPPISATITLPRGQP